MQLVNDVKKCKWLERTCYCVFFLAAFFLCRIIKYSDGDDAYFYEMAHSMGFFEYLKMRYITWEGRMTSEAMTYISMYLGKSFWNVANAGMLTLLVGGLIKVIKKISVQMEPQKEAALTFFMCTGILMMGVPVIGYAGFWITGSTFYLWSVVAGIWAAIPITELAFSPQEVSWKSYLYAIPCGFIASMGLEQIAAVVITFGALAIIYHFYKEKKIHILTAIEIVIMIAGLVLLFITPGTSARGGQELEWMPEFDTMSVPHHIFITLQWILSSFANYHKVLVSAVLLLAMIFYLSYNQKKQKNKMVVTVLTAAGVISVWISLFGSSLFSELGMGVPEGMEPVIKTATLSSLSGSELFACIWQVILLVLMGVLLWKTGETLLEKSVMLLILLASIASAAVMYFSPTMYVSGPRVMFVTAVLLWILTGILFDKIRSDKVQALITGYVAVAGIVNVVVYAIDFIR